MVEEQKEAAPAPETPAKKGGMVKMLIMGGGFLVLTGIVSVGTVFIIGTDEAVIPADSTHSDSSAANEHSDSTGDEPKGEAKTSAMDEMMENLAILDYVPGADEVTTKDGSMLVKDSVDAMTWIIQEKENLEAWKKQLEIRQLELNKLDKIVSQKILGIEKVETGRIAQLAKLYDGMQPTAVAQLMANLDDKTVVDVIPKMNAKQASAVLALLPPARAAKLSKQMMTIAEN